MTTANTPNADTDPTPQPGLQGITTTLSNDPLRQDRVPTLEMMMPWGIDPSLPSISQWVRLLQPIDPALARHVDDCGTHGPIRVEFTPRKRHLRGGRCKNLLCPNCGPQIADRESRLLSDLVHYLTAEEHLTPTQFAFGAITMSHKHISDTGERVRLLHAAMQEWTQQSWFPRHVLGWEFALDFSGTLHRHRGVLHAHWHVLLVLHRDTDLEAFKVLTHAFFQTKLGRQNATWDHTPDQWRSWLQRARLSPAPSQRASGFIWKGSHEVGACNMKRGKLGEGYQSLYTRSSKDLEVLVPLLQEIPPVERGGIVAQVHTLLDLRDRVHEDGAMQKGMDLPVRLWGQIDPLTRWFFVSVVTNPVYEDSQVIELILAMPRTPPCEWEARVEEVVAYRLTAAS